MNENPSRYPILRYYRATWASSSLPISSLLSLVSSISFRGRSRVSTNPSPPLFRPGWIYSASNDVYDVYPSAGAALRNRTRCTRMEGKSSPIFDRDSLRQIRSPPPPPSTFLLRVYRRFSILATCQTDIEEFVSFSLCCKSKVWWKGEVWLILDARNAKVRSTSLDEFGQVLR